MTADALAPNRSRDQSPFPGLPLYDLAGFTHRWVDAEGIRLHAVEGGGRPDQPSSCSPDFRRPGGPGAR